jgi:hypothetical protein
LVLNNRPKRLVNFLSHSKQISLLAGKCPERVTFLPFLCGVSVLHLPQNAWIVWGINFPLIKKE